jgi:hypothetical protein
MMNCDGCGANACEQLRWVASGGVIRVNLLDYIDIRLLLVGFVIVIILFLIIVFVLWSKLNKLRKSYLSMLNGNESLNVEDTLIELQGKMAALNDKSDTANQQIQTILGQMKKMKSHVGVHRYNAFAGSGNDLSFSVALLDEEQDGVVISGIHNREETYVYAKPLQQGQSKYQLSPEEKEAIHRSLQKK